jgi:hypothetical protein
MEAANEQLGGGCLPLLEPHGAQVVESRDEAGVAGRHGLLGHGQPAAEERRRVAVAALFAVKNTEGA